MHICIRIFALAPPSHSGPDRRITYAATDREPHRRFMICDDTIMMIMYVGVFIFSSSSSLFLLLSGQYSTIQANNKIHSTMVTVMRMMLTLYTKYHLLRSNTGLTKRYRLRWLWLLILQMNNPINAIGEWRCDSHLLNFPILKNKNIFSKKRVFSDANNFQKFQIANLLKNYHLNESPCLLFIEILKLLPVNWHLNKVNERSIGG